MFPFVYAGRWNRTLEKLINVARGSILPRWWMGTTINRGREEGDRESSIFKEIHFITAYVLRALFVFCSVVPFFSSKSVMQ